MSCWRKPDDTQASSGDYFILDANQTLSDEEVNEVSV